MKSEQSMKAHGAAEQTRSPWIVAMALAIGLLAQTFAGPIAGLIGAAIGAGAARVVVRHTDDHCE